MFNIGVCYENEKGLQRDMVSAAKWYLKAAEMGDVCTLPWRPQPHDSLRACTG